MKTIDFSTYSFPCDNNGNVKQKELKDKKQLKEYLLCLIQCDYDERAVIDGNKIVFNFNDEKIKLVVE